MTETLRSRDWVPDDGDWLNLIDDQAVSSRRQAAEERFKDQTTEQYNFIRRRAKNDLFFLATGMLEYELMSENLHHHYARWLQGTRDRQYRLTLLPRGHYKSTENTISESVQMALPNVADIPQHPYCLGPDIKLLIGHENRESSSRFLFEITEAFMSKEAMLAYFPECIPSRKHQRINKWELELPRKSHHKEPTFDTIGAGGAAQGRHYNWAKLDDLVGEDARDSELVMKRVLTWFDNVNSLLTRPRYDGWDLIGTHWSNADVYAHAIRQYGVDLAASHITNYFQKDVEKFPAGPLVMYGRGVEEENEIGEKVPIFPEEFTPEFINILRKNPKVFAAQYANNPKEGALTLFDPSHVKFYNIGRNDRLYVFAGEASWSVDRNQLDVVMLVDPSMGETKEADETGIVVTGTDHKMNIYVLEAFKRRMKPPELMEEIFRVYTRWWPRTISFESVAFSAVLGYWFNQKCLDMRIFPNIYLYKVQGKGPKQSDKRIGGLALYFAAGQVYILEGMNQLRDEIEWYPLTDSEHILDAFAQGPEVWQPGLDVSAREAMVEATQTIMDYRDAITGY